MKIIINADDLGHSKVVNDAIFELLNRRQITSTSILANSPCFEHAVTQIRNFKSTSFGVHLNITEFHPLTKQRAFRDSGLLDETGKFNGSIYKAKPSLRLLSAIEEEWAMQVQRVLDASVPISHFDSHHHVHTIPWLFLSLNKLQKRFSIWKVRTTLNLYEPEKFVPSRILLLKKKFWNWALRNVNSTKTTDLFTSFKWFIAATQKHDDLGNASTAELMCHPGYEWSSAETALLSSNWRNTIQSELISYLDL
jgi:predicted glycoside hydrolase/deacetylase ChbG (UPF0249 family)